MTRPPWKVRAGAIRCLLHDTLTYGGPCRLCTETKQNWERYPCVAPTGYDGKEPEIRPGMSQPIPEEP